MLDSPEEPPDELLANVQEKRVPLQIANAPPQQVGPLCAFSMTLASVRDCFFGQQHDCSTGRVLHGKGQIHTAIDAILQLSDHLVLAFDDMCCVTWVSFHLQTQLRLSRVC